jgi:hypothetical protein
MALQAAKDFALAYRLTRGLLLETCPSPVGADSSQMRMEGTFYGEAEEILA